MNIKIDPEFQSLIAPPTSGELELLEASIVSEGCRDALVVWGDILVDGHNRYEICCRLGIVYQTVSRVFADRESAADWIDANQLGRRNLTPDQMSLIRGRRYNRLKKNCVDNLSQNSPIGQNVLSVDTAELLAKQCGVSSRTIRRDGAAAAVLDAHPEKSKAVMGGEIKKSAALAEINPPIERPVDPSPEKITLLKSDYDELISLSEDLHAAQKDMESVLESDDKLSVAAAEIRSLNEQVRVLRTRLQSEQNKNNELIKIVKGKDKQISKLEKELEAYKLEDLPL